MFGGCCYFLCCWFFGLLSLDMSVVFVVWYNLRAVLFFCVNPTEASVKWFIGGDRSLSVS